MLQSAKNMLFNELQISKKYMASSTRLRGAIIDRNLSELETTRLLSLEAEDYKHHKEILQKCKDKLELCTLTVKERALLNELAPRRVDNSAMMAIYGW